MNEMLVATIDQGAGLSLTWKEAAMILSKSPIFRKREIAGGVRPFNKGERQMLISKYLSTFQEADQERRAKQTN